MLVSANRAGLFSFNERGQVKIAPPRFRDLVRWVGLALALALLAKLLLGPEGAAGFSLLQGSGA